MCPILLSNFKQIWIFLIDFHKSPKSNWVTNFSYLNMSDLSVWTQCSWGLGSSGSLCSQSWQSVINVLGQPVNRQDGTDMLSWYVGNQLPIDAVFHPRTAKTLPKHVINPKSCLCNMTVSFTGSTCNYLQWQCQTYIYYIVRLWPFSCLSTSQSVYQVWSRTWIHPPMHTGDSWFPQSKSSGLIGEWSLWWHTQTNQGISTPFSNVLSLCFFLRVRANLHTHQKRTVQILNFMTLHWMVKAFPILNYLCNFYITKFSLVTAVPQCLIFTTFLKDLLVTLTLQFYAVFCWHELVISFLCIYFWTDVLPSI
jgi:hypothetical protein